MSSSDRKAGTAGVNNDDGSHVLHSASNDGVLETSFDVAARDLASINIKG